MRVSRLFDYTLHVLVSYGQTLDTSISEISEQMIQYNYGVDYILAYPIYNPQRHIVYRRVSKLFDYTLHILVSWDLKLDISILVYTVVLLLLSIFIYHVIFMLVHVFTLFISCSLQSSYFVVYDYFFYMIIMVDYSEFYDLIFGVSRFLKFLGLFVDFFYVFPRFMRYFVLMDFGFQISCVAEFQGRNSIYVG